MFIRLRLQTGIFRAREFDTPGTPAIDPTRERLPHEMRTVADGAYGVGGDSGKSCALSAHVSFALKLLVTVASIFLQQSAMTKSSNMTRHLSRVIRADRRNNVAKQWFHRQRTA
jgi:hypothetical protein